MIVRLWYGWTVPENADAYEQLLNQTIVPGIIARKITGLLSVEIVRSREVSDGEVEFVTVMRFDDWAAVEAFAGPGGTGSVVPPEARLLLSRFEAHSRHYDVAGFHERSG
jgi:antibiotic biosynthesis monooxygenase (ABM) superfamily enzyme